MWGDRLLKSPSMGVNGRQPDPTRHPAIDLVPKTSSCDWHIRFRMIIRRSGCSKRRVSRAACHVELARGGRGVDPLPQRKDATDRMLGMLFTSWSGGGEAACWKRSSGPMRPTRASIPAAKTENAKRVTPQQLAKVIQNRHEQN